MKQKSSRNVLIGKVNLITETSDEDLASPIMQKNLMTNREDPLQSLQDKITPIENDYVEN